MSRSKTIACVVLFAAASFSSAAVAKELAGTYTPEQIKGACEKVGGEYFPQGQTGTYGCENHKNGNMVLCNKSNKCSSYRQTKTTKETSKVLRDLNLSASSTTTR